MSDEIEKTILEELREIKQDMKDVKDFIGERDIVKNSEYCKLKKVTRRQMQHWFDNGCPRVDLGKVSISAVDKWRKSISTRKPKTKQ